MEVQENGTSKPKHKGGRPVKYKTVEDMQVLIDAFFRERDEQKRPYTITGLALALNLTREGLLEYQNDKTPEFSDAIKKAKMKCQDYAEEKLFSGQVVAGVIFNLKNNHGWKDKIETEHTGEIKVVPIYSGRAWEDDKLSTGEDTAQ